jgi:peptidoglycan hydrolase-like protein with peptidoglycan-binding domain
MYSILKKVLALSFFVSFLLLSATIVVNAQMATSTDGSNDSVTERRQYIRGWRGQSNELTQKIQALGSTMSVVVPIPVLFGVELSNLRTDFGDPRSNGRTHIGNDIMAPKGTPVVSPTPAVVLRTGVGSGEGNYVYTANPGGETFVYMHLDTFGEGVTQGAVLEKGSVIGYVGNTGNASGGAPHLHFEIHNSSGTAVDPYTRINAMFSLEEKMQYLTKLFSVHQNTNALALVLVSNFRSVFSQATSLGVSFPEVIKTYLVSNPSVVTPIINPTQPGDLELGAKGNAVVTLQQYLIARKTGPQAIRLAQAGATGNFGPMTQSALIEYQVNAGITPADGYYGAVTRARVEATPILNQTPTTPLPTSTISLTRDLTLNAVGEDVRKLQQFLNRSGYTVSSSGAGSVGLETTFFGPATRAAVIKFQIGKGITPAVGYVGPITRSALSL